MTPPDSPEAVERLADELDAMNKDQTWVRYPTTLGRKVPAALRAYAQLLRQVEAVRSKRVPLAWTIRPKALKDAINALLDGEPGAQKE